MIYYAQSTRGFYVTEIHGLHIPEDAIEITASEHSALLYGQSEGRVISMAESGRPELRDPPGLTLGQIEAAQVAIVQRYMDDAARALRYDDIATAVTYADEPAVPKFRVEGLAFRAWRSQVWSKCYAILDDVKNGVRDIPTEKDLLSELPALEIPNAS